MPCDKFGYIDQVVLERTLSPSLSVFFNKLASSNVSFNKYYANAEDVLLFHLGTIGGWSEFWLLYVLQDVDQQFEFWLTKVL